MSLDPFRLWVHLCHSSAAFVDFALVTLLAIRRLARVDRSPSVKVG